MPSQPQHTPSSVLNFHPASCGMGTCGWAVPGHRQPGTASSGHSENPCPAAGTPLRVCTGSYNLPKLLASSPHVYAHTVTEVHHTHARFAHCSTCEHTCIQHLLSIFHMWGAGQGVADRERRGLCQSPPRGGDARAPCRRGEPDRGCRGSGHGDCPSVFVSVQSQRVWQGRELQSPTAVRAKSTQTSIGELGASLGPPRVYILSVPHPQAPHCYERSEGWGSPPSVKSQNCPSVSVSLGSQSCLAPGPKLGTLASTPKGIL